MLRNVGKMPDTAMRAALSSLAADLGMAWTDIHQVPEARAEVVHGPPVGQTSAEDASGGELSDLSDWAG